MFESIAYFFNIILYQPLFNALVLLYDYFPGKDFGLAIILLTIIIRLILYPLSIKAVQSQRALQKLQPKMQEIQRKYKDDKEKQAKETLELYKTEKINPFSGLLLAFIQLPILIALYQVFWHGLKTSELINLYNFVPNPHSVSPWFIGLIDLSKPNPIFAVLAGVFQFFQTKMLTPKKQKGNKGGDADMAAIMQTQMLYFFPVITILILFRLPAALGLYWIVTAVFSIIQQYFILKEKQEPNN